ncbi:hypothetical protein V2J09_013264 [Rumex salicifolius]
MVVELWLPTTVKTELRIAAVSAELRQPLVVTKDDYPVIFHDNFIITQAQGNVVEKRVTELTLDEFLSYGPQKQSGKEGKPLFRKTKNGRVVEWKVEKDDALCTLEEVFKNVGQTVGFDIELKLDDAVLYEEEEMRHVIKVVMDVVQKYVKKRVVIFSSFHPDATRLMRQIQDTYPVMFITKGGTEIFKDPRRNSLEEAIKHCRYAGLHGIVSEVKAIFKNPGMVAKIKECKLVLFTYGQLNNVPEAVYLQHLLGVDGVVVDFVQDITKALMSGFSTDHQHKINLWQQGRSFG